MVIKCGRGLFVCGGKQKGIGDGKKELS